MKIIIVDVINVKKVMIIMGYEKIIMVVFFVIYRRIGVFLIIVIKIVDMVLIKLRLMIGMDDEIIIFVFFLVYGIFKIIF